MEVNSEGVPKQPARKGARDEQTDPDFENAMERLGLDSRSLLGSRGYGPYPRAAVSERGRFAVAQELDRAMEAESTRPRASSLVEWLASAEACEIYRRGVDRLSSMTVAFPENAVMLVQARRFVAAVQDHYIALFPWDPPEPATAASYHQNPKLLSYDETTREIWHASR